MTSMSTQKACASLSSSSSASQWKHEVFLSFYWEDTRNTFTDHLHYALIQKGIIVYRDNVNLKEGKPIASELMKAIEESKYAIIILSKNYAFSKWCLNELVKILECKKEKGLKVLPIFYHVMPSDAGNQRETFGKAFLKHEEDRQVSTEQIQKWRTALKEVSKIRGRHLTDRVKVFIWSFISGGSVFIILRISLGAVVEGSEDEDGDGSVIGYTHKVTNQKIFKKSQKNIFDKLKCESIDDFEDLVGINSRVKEMMKLFNIMSEDVHFIGIWGMSGIGKTTLAYVIYNKICHQFEASSFICDVREIVENDKQGLVNLQKQLLSETLMEKVNIWNHLQGIKVMKKRLRYKKVLIVLDDVNKDKQLKALVGSPGWFGPGSRIIITSKYKHLLKRHHLGTTIHEVNGLDNDEALELFSWTVFKQPYPKNEFENLSNGFVKYAKGLPIALKVLGSSLIDRPRKLWEDYLHQLKEIPEGEILDKLEISYKGLEDTEQNLFLDIACFFKGEDEDRVVHIEGFGSYKDMETLKDKFLITILRGKLRMHDLIQEMGWRIVRRKSPQEPGLRSRLWLYKDVFHVLKYNTGKDDVEGMVLNSPPHKENLNAEAISNMKNLRLLKISNVHLPTGLNFLSNKLRMMEWHDYPLKFLPMSFQPDNLVELIMPRSHIEQLPVGFSKLDELRLLDLSDSKVLVKTPNFIGCPNLEMLIFQGCTSLYELHPSVGALNKLTLLNLKDCRSLTGLPCEINLKSLKKFILSGCSSLKKFSEIGTNMTRLSELYLDGIAVEELPSSLERLTGMTVLSLQGCKNLSSFPSVNLPSLNTLNLSGFKVQPPKSWLSHGFSLVHAAHAFFQGCFPIREAINLLLPRLRFIVSLNLADRNLWDEALPDDLSGLSSLQDLDLSKNIFTCLPDSFSQLSKLKHLNLNGCSKLQSLPNLPLSVGRVTARRCTSLKNYSNQNFVWTSGGTGFTIVICDDKDDNKMAFYPSPRVPFDDSDPLWERFIEEDGSHKDMSFMEFTSSTEISEWFSPQNPGSSVTIPLPSDLRYNSSWAGMALFVVVEIHENSYNVSSSQDYEVNIDFTYRKDMVEGPIHQIQLNAFNISEVPKFLLDDRSFGFKIRFPAGEREDHLEGCNSIEASFSSHCPYIEIKKCGARILYKKELVEFPQASIIGEHGLLKQDQQKVELESSKSDDQSDSKVQLKEKLKSLLLRVYQGDLARNHKYDYVFPHITVPNWFNNQSICSEMRIKLPRNLQSDGRWMGIAVCVYYTVHNHNQPAISSDNQDLTSFLDFYTPLDGHRVHLTRHRVFQDSKDIFVESSHRILVFYIPHLFLCLEGCCHVGASFERNNPGVMVKECGICLVFEQDVEDFMETLVQCMLGSPDAYHDFFYQNLSHQVEERVAGFDNGKDFGCSSSLQRMPQPMPKLLPSTENIPEGCTFTETSPSYTGFLVPPRKRQLGSIMSSESLIKACFQKNFNEGEIFDCCFAEREIPQWFPCQDVSSAEIELSSDICNDPDWMGFALCGLFSFTTHPALVRTNLASGRSEVYQFRCKMQTDSCPVRLVCYGILATSNELISLNQRAFIWVLFIPRTTHAHLWTQTDWVKFWLECAIPDLSYKNFGINLVFRKNMDELTSVMVQCSTPFDSFLDSCSPQCFYYIWNGHPEVFVGTKNSFEDLHPQRLFISQGETSGIAKNSYDKDSYPHNHFRYFHPSTAYNSCFPTRQTPKWFNHQSRGHLVTIEIPPNLYYDSNWLGLTLCASFLIPRDQNEGIIATSSHFLSCQFQTSKAGLDDQILGYHTTDEENKWLLRGLNGHIWISYIPGESFKHVFHQGSHIEASFLSNWPGVTVQKCGFRLLYKHDRVQFEQELKHCNTFISAHRDFTCQLSQQATKFEFKEEFMQVLKKVKTLLNENDMLGFDRHSKYSYCFPPVDILPLFNHNTNEPSVTIDTLKEYNDNEWHGFVLCAYFSIDEHQTAMLENFDSTISHYLVCHLETDIAGPEIVLNVHCTTKEEFLWLDTEDGFLWLSYIPRESFPDQFNQFTWIKASIISDWPGVMVQKCGLSFYHENDIWFLHIRKYCNEEYKSRDLPNQVMASYIEKTSREKSLLCKNDPQPIDQHCQSNLLDFDPSRDYNSCFPQKEIPHWFNIQSGETQMRLCLKLYNNSCFPQKEIPHWFNIQSGETHVRFCLTRKLYNNTTWIGVALCALFSVEKDIANVNDIMDSKTSFKLICHLEASNGPNDLSVKPRHIYWPTKEDLMMSLQGGSIWLLYIPRGSFPDWLYDCTCIKVSFKTNFDGLKVQKCGLRLLYQHSEENFKKIIRDCMKSTSDSSSFLNQMKIKNRNRKMRSWIESQLGEIYPHHRDQRCQSNLLGFDRCLFYDPHFPPSEILEWFSDWNDKHRVTIPLPPNLYNDSTWMGLVLCASFSVDVNQTAHIDIMNSEYNCLMFQLVTNIGTASSFNGYQLTKENLQMLKQGTRFIWLSYIPRGLLRNCPNQCSYIKASITARCPGLKVEQSGLRLVYNHDEDEFKQTIGDSMKSSSDDSDLIPQLTTDNGNGDKQKLDEEGTSSKTSSSREESNFESLRGSIDPKDKGKGVLEE